MTNFCEDIFKFRMTSLKAVFKIITVHPTDCGFHEIIE